MAPRTANIGLINGSTDAKINMDQKFPIRIWDPRKTDQKYLIYGSQTANIGLIHGSTDTKINTVFLLKIRYENIALASLNFLEVNIQHSVCVVYSIPVYSIYA